MMGKIPSGKYIGERVDDPPASDAEHFIKCSACGSWIDCRDLGSVLDHEGPLPHASTMSRIGRRTIFAVLLMAVLLIIWQVFYPSG